jgi:hypothetical protein
LCSKTAAVNGYVRANPRFSTRLSFALESLANEASPHQNFFESPKTARNELIRLFDLRTFKINRIRTDERRIHPLNEIIAQPLNSRFGNFADENTRLEIAREPLILIRVRNTMSSAQKRTFCAGELAEKRQIDQSDAAAKVMNPKLRSLIVQQNGGLIFSFLAIEKQLFVLIALFRSKKVLQVVNGRQPFLKRNARLPSRPLVQKLRVTTINQKIQQLSQRSA